MPKVDNRGLYPPRKVCEILGIGRTALYEYMNKGFLRYAIRIANSQRVVSGMEIKRFWLYGRDPDKVFLCYKYKQKYYCLINRRKKTYIPPTTEKMNASQLITRLAK